MYGYFGIRETSKDGYSYHIRKKIFSKGYVISRVTYDGINMGEALYVVAHYETMDLVNDWLRRN